MAYSTAGSAVPGTTGADRANKQYMRQMLAADLEKL